MSKANRKFGKWSVLAVFTAVSIAAAAAFVLIARENDSPAAHSREASKKSKKRLWKYSPR